MNSSRVAIIGATGYGGAELTVALSRHRHVELVGLYASSDSSDGAGPFQNIHPSLRRSSGPPVEGYSTEKLLASGAEVVFAAVPNEVAAHEVPKLLKHDLRVIDLSGAFRLRSASDYPQWYGFDHPAPELLSTAAYGLTEWCNGELRKAQLIANPGCYPTSILLALRPLTPFLDRRRSVICDSMSGVSGAGKKKELAYSFAELSGNCRAYGVGRHRHLPEMLQQLGLATYTPLVFTPHLLPTVRGILSTIHVEFLQPHTTEQISAAYEKAYATAPLVDVLPPGQLPELRDVVGTPRAMIGFTLLAGGRRAVIVSVIDNLLKGAATQAVQNFNRALDHPETEGLQ
jgi:N-acetyl-gamma-glutamyl-phosphate reductase